MSKNDSQPIEVCVDKDLNKYQQLSIHDGGQGQVTYGYEPRPPKGYKVLITAKRSLVDLST